MGAGSLLALMARHSLLPVRQNSKLALGDIALIEYERPCHVNHARLAEEQPQCQVLDSFHLDLAERFQQLQLQGSGNAHLNWLLDALASTLSTHSSLQSAITAIFNSSSGVSLAKHRADEVLHMLDVCTALKQAADDMDRHFGCLQHSLQSVGQALTSNQSLSSARLRAAAHRLYKCLLQEQPHTNVLCVIAGNHYRPLAEAHSSLILAAKSREQQSATTPLDPVAALLGQAVDGTMLTSLLALAAAVSSFEPPSPRKSAGTVTRACKVINKYLSSKGASTLSWAAPLRQLRQDLREEDISAAGGSLFRELQGLHSAAIKLHATITNSGTHAIEVAVVKQSIESLRKRLRVVQLCSSMLRRQLASFFQALIALRLTLLNS